MIRQRSAVLLAATALATVLVAAPAPARAGDTTAVAINTRDGMDMFRLAFRISRVMSDTVDTSNAAAAVSSCTDCETVAIAIQVVLILSDPTVVAPENLAVALNVECDLCSTLASAYQMVMTTGGPVTFTPEGHKQIADIRRRLLELRHTDLPIEQIQAQVDALADELKQVLATQLVSAGEVPSPASPETTPGESTTSVPAPSTSTTTTTAGPTTASSTSSTTTSSSSTSSTTTTTVAASTTTVAGSTSTPST